MPNGKKEAPITHSELKWLQNVIFCMKCNAIDSIPSFRFFKV